MNKLCSIILEDDKSHRVGKSISRLERKGWVVSFQFKFEQVFEEGKAVSATGI